MNFSNLRSRHVALLLLIVSLACYGVDYLVFGRAPEIVAGFLGNLAFLPVYTLFVTLIIEKVLKERERLAIKQKLNMVIGVFFSEVGTALLRDCLGFVRNSRELTEVTRNYPALDPADFKKATGYLEEHNIEVDSGAGDLACAEGLSDWRSGGSCSASLKIPTFWSMTNSPISSGEYSISSKSWKCAGPSAGFPRSTWTICREISSGPTATS